MGVRAWFRRPVESGELRKSPFVFRVALWSVGLCFFWLYGTALWFAVLTGLAERAEHPPPRPLVVFLVFMPLVLPLILAAGAAFRRRWRSAVTWAVVLGVTTLAAPDLARGPGGNTRGEVERATCASQLRDVGAAVVLYSSEHQGLYPASLGDIVPNYLRAIPTCPAAGADTYTCSYLVSADGEEFTVCCSGHHHENARCGPDVPQMTSQGGLVER